MSRPVIVVCAGALLFATGCSSLSFLLSGMSPGGKQQIVTGSVDQVSANLQATLGRAGIAVAATSQGQDVRIAGITKSGRKFALLLKRQQTETGEKTLVSIEWEADADEQFWPAVVELLLSPPPPPPAPDGPAERYSPGAPPSAFPGAK
jgi:hypothetical protein